MSYSTVLKRTLTTLFTAALLMGGFSTAQALTLQYTGPLFDTFNGLPNPMDGTERVTATITLDPSITTLTNGLNITDSDVTSFSMSALGRTINSGNATVSEFDLDIGLTLLPESWDFGAEALLEGGPQPENIFSSVTPTFLLDVIGIDDTGSSGNPLGISGINLDIAQIVLFSSESASWEVQQMAPIPEPSTMLLLGTGLAGIVAWRRKKVA